MSTIGSLGAVGYVPQKVNFTSKKYIQNSEYTPKTEQKTTKKILWGLGIMAAIGAVALLVKKNINAKVLDDMFSTNKVIEVENFTEKYLKDFISGLKEKGLELKESLHKVFLVGKESKLFEYKDANLMLGIMDKKTGELLSNTFFKAKNICKGLAANLPLAEIV